MVWGPWRALVVMTRGCRAVALPQRCAERRFGPPLLHGLPLRSPCLLISWVFFEESHLPTSRILFPFSTVETGDFSGDSASAADSAGTSPPAPLLAFEGEGLGGSAVDL